VKAHDAMIKLYDRMPLPLQRAKMMREQLGFALNREGRFEDAEKVLKAVIEEFGPSSETNGLLGRIYKDRWEIAKKEGRPEARALLKRAAETYLQGFEADWRDAYPGINAVTLMEMMDKPDPAQARILPVVRFAASQKAKKSADYWDYATLLELAVLGRDPADAEDQMAEALALARASWEVDSTARNLRLVRETRTARGEDAAWIKPLEDALAQTSRRLDPPKPVT
jgi:tetratricopeptide (TPR) repeat protein